MVLYRLQHGVTGAPADLFGAIFRFNPDAGFLEERCWKDAACTYEHSIVIDTE